MSKGKKIRVGVVFGGRSAEHEVSLVSAASVIAALDKRKYEVVPIGITPEGKWVSGRDVLAKMKRHGLASGVPAAMVVPDPAFGGLVSTGRDARAGAVLGVDVLFPVVHGTFGEDGTIQGLFELAGIPYVGAGVLGSSVGMDKVVSKILCVEAGLPVAPWYSFLAREYKADAPKITHAIDRTLRYPMFVKPANSGSSVGISKVRNRRELAAAIRLALRYDRKVLVEQSIEHAREIEVSVLGNDDPIAAVPGEIISSNEFYDYDAKYVDGKSEAVIPAALPPAVKRRLQGLATRAFAALQCSGMARVDFLVRKSNNAITFNEINTIPGFTSISMYPKLWEASGISYPRLLDRLIRLAFERFRERRRLQTTYRPKSDWYNQ